MDPTLPIAVDVNRRTFLGYGVSGLGMLALNGLVNPQLFAAETAVTGPFRASMPSPEMP